MASSGECVQRGQARQEWHRGGSTHSVCSASVVTTHLSSITDILCDVLCCIVQYKGPGEEERLLAKKKSVQSINKNKIK
ncbi:hypothetical protein NEQG_02710 [Nematocida parisii ERTm3]|uniref:Uncharacterized protein n=1 Tax=Nematocida parisii (strain ERTm3) TaxID=935791 RepID=I3ED01_NEMP3|nr:hypothetical protein NEQG_02710 [Nematocida parisii ERTm3]